MLEAITKRVRRYPLPGESAFVTFDPRLASLYDAFGGDGGCGEAERGCGFRDEGSTYACVPTRSDGRGQPIESFVLCNPFRVDADEYGLTALGAKLVELPEVCLKCGGGGKMILTVPGAAAEHSEIDCSECKGLGMVSVFHVWDIIGREHYPNVADFIEEARRLGVSRKLGFTEKTDYAKLTERSRLFLLHSRAIIENPQDYYSAMTPGEVVALREAGGCPKNQPQHDINVKGSGDGLGMLLTPYNAQAPGCAALYWHDLEAETCAPVEEEEEAPINLANALIFATGQGEEGRADFERVTSRFSRREMPSFAYGGFARPEGIKALHNLGVFAIFPLARLEIVDPSGGDEYNEAINRASASKLPVKITNC